MSAYIVDRSVIDRLIEAANVVTRGQGGYPLYFRKNGHRFPGSLTADQMGRLLWGENLKSVATNYPAAWFGGIPRTMPTANQDAAEYTTTIPDRPPTIVEALKLLDSYEYQSCEHPGWPESLAYDFVDTLRRRLITMLPGYNDAPWAA